MIFDYGRYSAHYWANRNDNSYDNIPHNDIQERDTKILTFG